MRRSKYILAAFIATVLFVLPVAAQFVGPVQTVRAETMEEARNKELQYAYNQAVAYCILTNQLHRDSDKIQISLGPEKWMKDKTIDVSRLIDTDGERQCNNLFSGALTSFGYDSSHYVDFFKDMRYSCNSAGTSCEFKGDTKDQLNNYKSLVASKNIASTQTPAMRTVELLSLLQATCKVTAVSDPTPAQISDAKIGANKLTVVYEIISTDGIPTITPSIFAMDDPGKIITDPFEPGVDATCNWIASELRKSSEAAANQQLKELQQKKRDLYLAAALKAACGEPPSGGVLNPAYTSCVAAVNAAFPACYAKAFSAGTGIGSNNNNDDVTTTGNQGLANCLAGKTSTTADAYMAAFADIQSALNQLTNSYQNSTSVADDSDDCPLPSNAEMRWLGCAVFGALRGVVDTLHEYILQFMYVSINSTFSDNIRFVSTNFRNIAIGIIFIAGLIMIISQAMGFELFDAYTIKKLMPRLIVALLGIVMAWPLMKLAVVITNDLGLSLGSVLDKVSGYGTTTASTGGGSGALAVFFGGAAGVGTFLALGALGGLSLLGTAALAMFIGMLVLAVRQVVVLMCIVMAPVAIACYVLPGTQKVWAFWKNTFITTLLMYPIIMLFIGAGRAASAIIGSNNESGAMNILAIMLYFAPYFMLPYAFKLAGGLMSTIFGLANDRGRGAFDRMKKFRGKQMSKNWEDTRAGNRFKGKNAISNRLNRSLEYGANINKAGFNPVQARSKMRTALSTAAHDDATKFMKENQSFMAIGADDAKVFAAKATNRSDIERRLADFDYDRFGGDDPQNVRARTDATNQILQAQREASPEVFQKARARAMASTGTGYHRNGVARYDEMLDDINEAYGNDRNGAGRALAEMRSALTNSGHVAGMAGYGTWAGALEGRYRAGEDGKPQLSGDEAHRLIMSDTIDSVPAGNALYGKPTSAAALGIAHRERLEQLTQSMSTGALMPFGKDAQGNDVMRAATEKDVNEALAASYGILQAMNTQAPQNAKAFGAQFLSQVIPGSSQLAPASPTGLVDKNGNPLQVGGGKDLTVRQLIELASTSEEFNNMAYNYQYQAIQDGANFEQQRQAQMLLQQQGVKPGAPINQPPGQMPGLRL